MYQSVEEQTLLSQSQRENLVLKQRIIELEAQNQQKQVKHKELAKKVEDLIKSQEGLRLEFESYQEQVRGQSSMLQQSLEERNNCIGMLRSRVTMVEQSNDNLAELLRQSNGKVVQLMKQVTSKNRFIKQYLEHQGDIE